MTAATFILIPKQPQDPAAAAEALKFFAWAYAKGAKMAEELDYVPMPKQGRGPDRENVGQRNQGFQPASRSTHARWRIRLGATWQGTVDIPGRLAALSTGPPHGHTCAAAGRLS